MPDLGQSETSGGAVRYRKKPVEIEAMQFDGSGEMPDLGRTDSRSTFAADLTQARAELVPVMALRRDSAGWMDDVVVKDVEMFRAEMMSDDNLWLCCYFRNGERVTFSAFARKRGCLEFQVGEMPSEWEDFDAKS